MAKQLVYQGCQGQDAALVTWTSQNFELPNTYKTIFTPIKVFIAQPEQGGELSRYNYYSFFYRYRIKEYNQAVGGPNTEWRDTDGDGNPLIGELLAYGAPTAPYLKLQGTDPNGITSYMWTTLVRGVTYGQTYDEVTEQWIPYEENYDEEIEFIQSYSQPIYSGQTYGEVEILESYVLDENGNRINLGGEVNNTTWQLIVAEIVAETYEEVFKLSFSSQSQGIFVDCDQCANNCLKVTSDDKK
ncbi:MAG: hypothetical protein KME13_03715 [Myxacorys californica WJT36-NPBG1]|jgi:hypothetical protein|nr:hypothetical protein [Myxacorys californica WJT36-NPBG1]